MGSSRSHRGPGSRCSAPGPPWPWPRPRTCCAAGTCEMRTLHAEWTKFRTVAAPAWLLLAAATLTAALSAAAVAALRCPVSGCATDLTKLSLTGVQLGQAVVAVVAVLVVGGEYSTGMIST